MEGSVLKIFIHQELAMKIIDEKNGNKRRKKKTECADYNKDFDPRNCFTYHIPEVRSPIKYAPFNRDNNTINTVTFQSIT